MSDSLATYPRFLGRLVSALAGSATLACGLLLIGFFAFTHFLPWWYWIAAFLAALVVSLLYGSRHLGRVLPSLVLFFVVNVVVEYVFVAHFLARRLN